MNVLRRYATVLCVPLFGVLLLAACSGDDAAPTSMTVPATSISLTRVYPSTPLPALVGTGYRVEYPEAPWIRGARADQSTLVIFTMDSGIASCTRFDHADVYETAESVTVRTFQRNAIPTAPNAACAAIGLAATPITIPLSTSLGDRKLIGGCDDLAAAVPPPTWPLESYCQALHDSVRLIPN